MRHTRSRVSVAKGAYNHAPLKNMKERQIQKSTSLWIPAFVREAVLLTAGGDKRQVCFVVAVSIAAENGKPFRFGEVCEIDRATGRMDNVLVTQGGEYFPS